MHLIKPMVHQISLCHLRVFAFGVEAVSNWLFRAPALRVLSRTSYIGHDFLIP